ncbi:MAG TPA: hypothetical protein VF039_03485 [Longimicrobiales bacterium]
MSSYLSGTSPRAMRRRWLVLLVALCAGAAACSDDPTEPDRGPNAGPAASIRLPTDSLSLYPAESVRFVPVVLDSLGRELQDPEIRWIVGDTGVVAIDSAGLLTARAHGSTELTVEAGDVRVIVPVRVTEFVQISGRFQDLCALDVEGRAWCRGRDRTRLLHPEFVHETFRAVPTSLRFSTIAVGQSHVCGLSDGTAYCWGTGNHGQTGNYSNLPIDSVVGGHVFQSISAGGEHNCAIDSDGAAWCWGRDKGALGTGNDYVVQEEPVRVAGDHVWRTVEAGWDGTCGLPDGGVPHCWGDVNDALVPTPLPDIPQASVVSSYWLLACAAESARVDCAVGELEGRDLALPRSVTLPAPVVDVEAAVSGFEWNYPAYVCALTEPGDVYCWGRNARGFLGQGSMNPPDGPVRVLSNERFVEIVAGWYRACGLTPQGALYCWGLDVFEYTHGIAQSSAVPLRIAPPRP